MKRVRMVVAYDGTNYCGWQFQPNGITIEEVLNKALSDLLREPVVVIGASRTDSGVHAEGNVAVFDTENRMPADKICFALNQRLPEDIRILKSEEVAPDWHPRKCNCTKTYEYRILNRKIDMPTLRLYSHFCYFPLDVENMKAAARYLVGEHDFKSFCTVRGQAEETVRTIYSLDVDKCGDMITIRISGSGFLYNMVRIIAGTLMKVGMGVYPPEHVEEILDARDRQAAGQTALPKGLTLVSLDYETKLRSEIVGENKFWKYRLRQDEIVSKQKAYLEIERCVDSDFDRLLVRVVHQAVRNGALWVFVKDDGENIGRDSGKDSGKDRECAGLNGRGERALPDGGGISAVLDRDGESAASDRDGESTAPDRGSESAASAAIGERTSRIVLGKPYGYYTFEACPDAEGWYVTSATPDWREKQR